MKQAKQDWKEKMKLEIVKHIGYDRLREDNIERIAVERAIDKAIAKTVEFVRNIINITNPNEDDIREQTAKEIFAELDKEISIEIKRLKKFDDENWKKGNKEDGRKSTASILTLGINVRRIINRIKSKFLKEKDV